MRSFLAFVVIFSLLACKSRKKIVHDIPDYSTVELFLDTDDWFCIGPHTTTNPIRKREHTSPHGVGRLHRIVVDPTDSNILYAGAPSSGLFKSTNRGNTWTHKFPSSFSSGVMDVEIDPKNPNRIFVVATVMALNSIYYSYGLFVSEDKGETWNKTGLNFTPKEYNIHTLFDCAISSLNNKNIIVCGGNKIYVSNDGAKTFTTKKYKENTGFYYVVSKPNSNTFIVSGNTNCISFNAKDFTIIKGLPNYKTGDKHSEHANMVFVFGQSKIYGWSSTKSGSFFQSENGKKWGLVASRVAYPSAPKLTLNIIPETAEKEFLLGSIRVFNFNIETKKHKMLTTNITNRPNFVHDDARHMFYENKSNVLWMAHDGGVSVSYDHGKTWNDKNGNGLITMLSYGLTIKEEEKLSLASGTLDMSNSVYINNQWYCTSNIYGDGGNIGWRNKDRLPSYIVRNGEVNRFDSASGNYRYMHPPDRYAAFDAPFRYFNSTDELILGTKNLWLYKAGGWKNAGRFKNKDRIQAFDYIPETGKTLVGKWDPTWSTSKGKLKGKLLIKNNLHSEEEWKDLTPNLRIIAWRSISGVAINPNDDSEYTVCFAGFDKETISKVYQTNDGGITWKNISTGLPNLPANCVRYITYNHKMYLLMGNDDGVYIYHPVLKEWKQLGKSLPKSIISSVEKHKYSNTLVATTYGRAVWAIRLTDDLMPY